MKSKLFLFTQNNSGGHFDVDDKVCHRVVIEAYTQEEAIDKFLPMIKNQSYSCPCCGDRWYPEYPDELDMERYNKRGVEVYIFSNLPPKKAEAELVNIWKGFSFKEKIKVKRSEFGKYEVSGYITFKTPEHYLEYLAKAYHWTTPDIRIFYLDGTIKEIQ